MSSIYKIILFSIFAFALISCNTKSNDLNWIGNSSFNSSVSLLKEGELVLEIDSVTPAIVTSYFHLVNQNALVIMNVFTNSLYKYSLESGKLLSIDAFPKDGSNGIGQLSTASEFIYQGDTIIFHDRNNKTLTMVNSKTKEVLLRTNFARNYDETPYGMWMNWINAYKNGYSMSAAPTRYWLEIVTDDVDSMEFFFNPETQELSKIFMPIPEVYHGNRWLPEFMRYYREFNPMRNEYLYSWPVADSIYVKNSRDEFQAHYMGTNNYKKNEPLPEEVGPYVYDIELKMTYYYEQGVYSHLYYDQFKNLLFRYSFSGVKEGRVDMNEPLENKDLFDRTLIISDGEYNKVGEFSADIYVPYVAVFTNDHVLLLRETENEDYLVFDQFKVSYNE